jgi:hypothetical protein
MRQLGVQLVNFGLFVFCCFQVAGVVNRIAADSLRPAFLSQDVAHDTGPRSAPGWDERKAILDRNLFGAQIVPVEKPPEPVEEVVTVEETKLPLVLIGTMAGIDPADSAAAIRDTRSRSSTVVRVGDEVENHADVRVTAIERGRVLLSNRGRSEELLLSESATPGSASGAGRETPASRRSMRRSRRATANASGQSMADTARRLKEMRDRVKSGELSLEDVVNEMQELD